MNSITQSGAQTPVHRRPGPDAGHKAAAGAAFAITTAAAIGAASLTSAQLAAPAIALMATGLAAVTGLTAYAVNPAQRDKWLTAAGVFALAAIAASIVGDPAAVLSIGK